MTVIGIDIGGSTTKIIGIDNGVQLNPLQVKATDPITSVYGAFGRYMSENGLALDNINRIMVTGVGATHIKEDIYGISTSHVDEFSAIGRGGLSMSGLKKAIVVSMGTGTAYVHAQGDEIYHMGGTGVGGGTLLGLSARFLDIRNFESIITLAESGNIDNVDLSIGDLSVDKDAYMPSKITASNFGKISDYATKNDIALGLVNMVLQTIGMMAVFASKIDGTQDIVLCGNLTCISFAESIFKSIEDLHSVKFHIPDRAEYATALGAALSL